MTKTNSVKKIVSLLTIICILASAFSMFAGVSAGAASDKVKMYSTDVYFSKYGIRGTNVFVQTKDNASNQKVYVHYNPLKGQEWKDAEAQYVKTLDDGSKLWKAYITSYNTEYAIKYVANGVTTWDNNNGKNYTDEDLGVAPITVKRGSYYGYGNYYVNAVLQNYAYVKDVKVRYTENNWKSYKDVSMKYMNTYANGTECWSTALKLTTNDASGFEYCVSYTVNGRTYWANNFGENYDASYRVYP
ncbi:MAG TPA: hypothetical protein DEO32_06475 [Ruminococcaceae bacterium]|nr:hypothetical protein [Oscillospiraceae bacterium]